MKSVAVVGGGVAGLVAALLAVRKGYQVTVIESANECGGLLGSFRGTDGSDYDYGTHLLRDTGIEPLDQLLFSDLGADEWQRLPYLKNGAYFAGTYSGTSGFPNANFLPKAIYEEGLADILRRSPDQNAHETAEEYLVARFGATFARHLFEPALRKFCGAHPGHLASTAPVLFGLNRILVSTPEVSRELKRSPHFDGLFGFHSFAEGVSGLNNYYPAKGGIGQWITALQGRLEADGVSVQTGVHVEAVSHDSSRITEMTLSDGRRIEATHVIWTINAAALLHRTSLRFPSFKPTFRKTCLYCYTVDRPFHTDNYYFVCYDPGLRSFRTTLYSNLRSDPAERGHYSCCVEVFCDAQEKEPEDAEILEEQIKMGVIDEKARWTLVGKKIVPMGFPVMSPQFVKMSEELGTFVANSFENVLLLGKASGSVFLMNAVLSHAYEMIEQRI